MASHTGTHIDAPYHFVADGNTMDDVPLEMLIGPADVVDLAGVSQIDAATLAQLRIPDDCKRLLLKTKNSLYWERADTTFHRDYVGLLPDAAKWLIDQGIGLIGADYLGVHDFDHAVPVHRTLLGANVVILEGLKLYDIAPGCYQLVCLPLKIAGADGAPARAVLID
jgi:arylformamidase